MKNQIRWRATWRDHRGQPRELVFEGPESRVVARVDFQLKLMEMGDAVPNQFDLDEGTIVLPRLPIPRRTV